ncbi:MAG: hypothetical protein KDC32_14100 [Saprospiraceae bacterium]|nr:hypothetical protein [Saprospiraceae bacterium]MCB0682024.1 hypothetical protein [Saprospiraceae bacterium]
MRIPWILFVLSLSATGLCAASPYFEWSPLARQAYEKVIQLRFDEARSLLQRLEATEPDNDIRLLVENYLDFFTVFIDEDAAVFERLESNKDRRLDRLRKSDPASPWHLYLQADIRLQWALARLKFEEYATAFFEVNKAFKLLRRNAERFPDFMPTYKDLGILHAMVGTIPDNYQWTVRWLSSLEGTIDQGQAELERVIRYAETHEFIFEEETYVLYAYLLLHLGRDDRQAWEMVRKSRLHPGTNPLACFILANVALRTGRNDEAIRLLEQRPSGRSFHPFPYLDFMLGLAKLQRLDADADLPFQRFLDDFKGRNFIKEAYQKLGWHYLLQGDEPRYRECMRLCRERGYTVVENDQSALREAEGNRLPHPQLLQARLLFDGGYYQRADQILRQLPAISLRDRYDQLEHTYRSGRILQQLNRPLEALQFYEKTIAEGEDDPWYFACRAALESGHIYEAMGDRSKARDLFEKCLSIKPKEHRTGLHQAAKAGLGRVK